MSENEFNIERRVLTFHTVDEIHVSQSTFHLLDFESDSDDDFEVQSEDDDDDEDEDTYAPKDKATNKDLIAPKDKATNKDPIEDKATNKDQPEKPRHLKAEPIRKAAAGGDGVVSTIPVTSR